MDMTKEALQYLMDAGMTQVIVVDEKQYTTKPVHRVKEPLPAAIIVESLDSIVDYLESSVDIKQDVFIHIVDPRTVRVYSALDKDMQRACFIEAQANTPKIPFGQYMDAEKFIVALQAMFCEKFVYQDENNELAALETDKKKLLKFVGNIREENIRSTSDDGVTQTATVKTGIAKVADVDVPNPVMLAPYRTFIEIDQPASEFVLRMKDGPEIALHEADGGAWEREAVKSIREYLDMRLEPGNACRPFKVVILG